MRGGWSVIEGVEGARESRRGDRGNKCEAEKAVRGGLSYIVALLRGAESEIIERNVFGQNSAPSW